MALGNSKTTWGWPARVLHWSMAVLIVGMLSFGFWLTTAFNPGDVAKLWLVQLHKSIGFCVFVLGCLRIIWRTMNPSPELPPATPVLVAFLARIGHLALYVLMLAIPLTGWLAVSSSPYNDPGYMNIPNEVFGLFAMPDPYPEGSHAISDRFMLAHLYLAMTLMVVLIVHVLAALKHAMIDRDGVLRRMLSG